MEVAQLEKLNSVDFTFSMLVVELVLDQDDLLKLLFLASLFMYQFF